MEKYGSDKAVFEGKFSLTNIGNGSATTQLIRAVIYRGGSLPPDKNPCSDHALDKALKMAPGTGSRLDFPPLEMTAEERRRVLDEKDALYAIGKVIYIDNAGNARRTGFARKLNTKTGRFEAVADPDYEYED